MPRCQWQLSGLVRPRNVVVGRKRGRGGPLAAAILHPIAQGEKSDFKSTDREKYGRAAAAVLAPAPLLPSRAFRVVDPASSIRAFPPPPPTTPPYPQRHLAITRRDVKSSRTRGITRRSRPRSPPNSTPRGPFAHGSPQRRQRLARAASSLPSPHHHLLPHPAPNLHPRHDQALHPRPLRLRQRALAGQPRQPPHPHLARAGSRRPGSTPR